MSNKYNLKNGTKRKNQLKKDPKNYSSQLELTY
jgi:hypothetical protein